MLSLMKVNNAYATSGRTVNAAGIAEIKFDARSGALAIEVYDRAQAERRKRATQVKNRLCTINIRHSW